MTIQQYFGRLAGLTEGQTLSELRSHPEQNTRESVYEFLKKHKDNPKAYLHTTTVQKVGIYPKSSWSHDTPVGVFAFRLQDIWEDQIERWNTGEYKRGLHHIDYYGGPHTFVLESDIPTDFPGTYSEADLAADCEKMKAVFGLSDEGIARLRRTARTNQNFRDIPAGYFWGMVKAYAARVDEFDKYTPTSPKRWNVALRKLGYHAFNDPGYGVLHGAEPAQAVFLDTTGFRVIDHMLDRRQQQQVELDGTTYKGGRLPRDLVMGSIPNTLFYNYEPAAFAKVRSWTVRGMDYHDVAQFAKFVPWNGVGIIDTVNLGDPDNYTSKAVEFLQKPLPHNIRIKSVFVGGRLPMSLIGRIPADYPVEQIKIHQFAWDNGITRLPPEIQAKIVRI